MLARSLKLSPAHFPQLWGSCSFFQRDTCVATTVESYMTSSDPNNGTHLLCTVPTHPPVHGSGSWGTEAA